MTTIIVCYNRFDRLNDVIDSWKSQVDDIMVLDNSGTFKRDDVLVLSSNRNLGPQAKYPLAFLASDNKSYRYSCVSDPVIFADDDIIAKPGLVDDLGSVFDFDRIVSILGKQFTGTSYYTSSCFYGAELKEPLRVDWVGGGCTMTARRWCDVRVADCPSMTVDDIWWEHEHINEVELWIAPTNKYEFLKNEGDELHTSAECKEWREKVYLQYGYDKTKPRLR